MRLSIALLAVSALLAVGSTPAHADGRTTVDLPDTISGIQIKPVFLLPVDIADTQADTNGQIANLLTEGNAFLERNLGKRFEIDTNASGEYDIAFFQTKRSANTVSKRKKSDLDSLLFESRLASNSVDNRKIYVFFLAVNAVDGRCGFANMPGNTALVFMGVPGEEGSCSGPSSGFRDYATWTWVHEVFHTLGVDHISNPCDLMSGSSEYCSSETVVIDPENLYYVNADEAGIDVLSLPVWSGNNTSPSPLLTCKFLRKSSPASLSKALCPLGEVRIGTNEFCSGPGRAILQQLKKGRWVNRATGSFSRNSWGKPSPSECYRGDSAPTVLIKANKPSVQKFRWVVNGYVEKPFQIQWQR